MSLSPLVEQHLEDLARHPHIENITEIKPLVYKLTYWPRDLESLYAEIPYTLKLTIPETYPEKPPFVTFLQKIHHLNIHPSTGQLSMSILSEDWSPFLNLKAVINSLDQVLQQPDQTYASTPILLEQYQTDITTYVQSVKESLQKNHPKENCQKNEHIYTEQQVEEVIEVDDFNEYQIKRAENNFGSHQHQDEIQNIQFGEKTDFIKMEEGQKHDYSFNHDALIKDNISVNEKKGKKEQRSDGQLSVKVQKSSFKPSQLKPPALNVDSQNTSPRSNQNNNNLNSTNLNTDPKTNLTKFQKVVNQSNNLLTGKNQHQRSYQGLKQNMARCKQLIAIFSQELDEIESNMEKNKSKRIKTLLQDKCNKLEQMILELFEINQKTQLKLMDMVRKGANQYL